MIIKARIRLCKKSVQTKKMPTEINPKIKNDVSPMLINWARKVKKKRIGIGIRNLGF